MNRTGVIQAVIDFTDAQSYLEIGIRNPADNFSSIRCAMKQGVDPCGGGPEVVKMDSDTYFDVTQNRYDVIFVDGDHRYEQVKKDVMNAIRNINRGGTIIMHDCNPQSADACLPEKPDGGGPWNGEAWRVYAEMRTRRDLVCECVDCDHGMGIIRRSRERNPLGAVPATYAEFAGRRNEVLNLISPAAFVGKAKA